jgi:hypothetical protein
VGSGRVSLGTVEDGSGWVEVDGSGWVDGVVVVGLGRPMVMVEDGLVDAVVFGVELLGRNGGRDVVASVAALADRSDEVGDRRVGVEAGHAGGSLAVRMVNDGATGTPQNVVAGSPR